MRLVPLDPDEGVTLSPLLHTTVSSVLMIADAVARMILASSRSFQLAGGDQLD